MCPEKNKEETLNRKIKTKTQASFPKLFRLDAYMLFIH